MAEALDLNIPLGEGGAESVEKIIKPLLDLDKEKTLEIFDKILNGEDPKPGSYRGRLNTEPENNRKTLMDVKNA